MLRYPAGVPGSGHTDGPERSPHPPRRRRPFRAGSATSPPSTACARSRSRSSCSSTIPWNQPFYARQPGARRLPRRRRVLRAVGLPDHDAAAPGARGVRRRSSLRRFYARRALRLLPAFGVLFAIAVVMHSRSRPATRTDPTALGLLGMFFYVGQLGERLPPRRARSVLAHLVARDRGAVLSRVAGDPRLPAAQAVAAEHDRRDHDGRHRRGGGVAGLVLAHHFGHRTLRRLLLSRSPAPPGAGRRARPSHRVWNRLYFGSDTRADALLVGCLTAIVLFWLLPQLGARARMRLSAARGRRVRRCARSSCGRRSW